jgi:hypothetical protein
MNCPHCNANWDGGDIYETLLERSKDPDDLFFGDKPKKIERIAKNYGWTKENPTRFQRLITVYESACNMPVLVSSAWQCPDCKHYFDEDPTKTHLTQN